MVIDMRKKILSSIIGIVLLSLIAVTALLTIIFNYENEENTKLSLRNYDFVILNYIKNYGVESDNIGKLIAKKNNDLDIRVTVIDSLGKVIYDSLNDEETLDNHNSREEIIKARKSNEGYDIRYSATMKKNLMYYAICGDNGYIIRTSMTMSELTAFEQKYLKYYIIVFASVFCIAVFVSLKISNNIVKPVKNLQNATGLIANGELSKRTEITSNDEIGSLGKTFNDMADKLENTINDAVDKQNKLEAILRSMDSGVIAIDRNYKIIMINDFARKLFNLDKYAIGERLLDVIRNYKLENIFKNNSNDYNGYKLTLPNGKNLRIKTTDIINNNETIGRVAVLTDITDITKLENMRSQFVTNVSHELKTPLTSIKGFAETLKDVDDVETKNKFLNIINDEAERLTRLINDILSLSSLEAHKEIKADVFDINASMNDIYELMKNTAEKKGIVLRLINNNVPQISGNNDNFKQMIINLVDNAIKYSEKGCNVVMGCEKCDTSYVKLWVEDNGIGIPEKHLERLFERFYRVDKARSRESGGTGLGLAIVKHIVLNFNGTIEVESEVKNGSKFIIKIPSLPQ